MVRRIWVSVFLAFAMAAAQLPQCCFALGASGPEQKIDGTKPVPFDTNVHRGRLENGLLYYVRTNHKPEHRAELRLVLHAGSIQEDDDQKGLAHFAEHMAFNGTKHFKKQELVNYLESIGMKFGADVNAYTSFDETVYTLTIPTDKPEILEKGMQILEDWAHSVSYQKEEIDKERPVIVEEWRTGRGAAARLRDQQWPILLKGSKYADHMPIGSKELIETFKPETLVRFYKDWYRPDLMAVIAVGDFDASAMEKRIRQHFAGLSNPKKLRRREIFPVPPHEETRFAVASDPENPRSVIQVIYKSELRANVTIADIRRLLVDNLMFGMLNQRLAERTRDAEPPYLGAFSGRQRFVGPIEALVLGAVVGDNGVEKGFSTVLEEARRAELYGFTDAELERTKAEVLRYLEKQYENREKTESAEYAENLVQSFLYGEAMTDISWDYEFAKSELPGIELGEINEIARAGFAAGNRVVLVSLPQKEGIARPSEADLTSLFEKGKSAEVKPYEENVPRGPLVENMPRSGVITKESTVPELGITEWRLSNEVRVLLLPTDYKNDEIQFSAWSPGGSSLVSDAESVSADYADELADLSGVGNFDEIQLEKVLAGKIAGVSPYISFYYEGFSGRSAPKDFETALQLIYLDFTAPRMDPKAFASFMARQTAALQNRNLQPETRFQDEVTKLVTENHPRTRPPSLDLLKELNQERAFKIYQDRFADAGDFTFAFVGSFEIEKIKPLILTYLGGLPDLKRNENWKDLKILPPEGVVEREYHFGKEPKSRVTMVFHGPFDWNLENRLFLRAMCDYLNIRLRTRLREDLGGVYGVSVSSVAVRVPQKRYQVLIRFGCAPERVKELVQEVLAEIKSLQSGGADPKDLAKVRETMHRQHETDLNENRYWLGVIESAYKDQEDVRDVLQFEQRLQKVTPEIIRQSANTYFAPDRYLKAILMPEDQSGK